MAEQSKWCTNAGSAVENIQLSVPLLPRFYLLCLPISPVLALQIKAKMPENKLKRVEEQEELRSMVGNNR